MDLPDITHLQFLILGYLCDDQHYSGRSIRDWLREQGIVRTLPAFYRFMGRLEKAGYVLGRDEPSGKAGKALLPRSYRILKLGRDVCDAYRIFSLSAGAKGEEAGPFSRALMLSHLVEERFSPREIEDLTNYLSELQEKKKSKRPKQR